MGTQLTAAPETMEITAPQAVKIAEPQIPANYVRWGIPGHVVVDFQINNDGWPEKIKLVDYDDRQYAMIVKDAIRQWRFERPDVAGITYRLPFTFKHNRLGKRPH